MRLLLLAAFAAMAMLAQATLNDNGRRLEFATGQKRRSIVIP
jgi:hypothetical protein